MSKRNSNAAEIILFLHRLTSVLIEYFKELEEESIRDNFVIIYELMDEMMDFGFPQTTESKILQEYVNVLSPFTRIVLSQCSLGTSHRNPTSLKYKSDHQLPSPMPCRGGQRVSDTARMKSSWMSLRVSTCW